MITLNELIEILKTAPKPEGRVYFGFARCVPTTVDSWRGAYDEPALGWEPAGYSGNVSIYPTVSSLLLELEDAKGQLYSGWKGGDYYYNGSETLHIDNIGDCTNTEITRVEVKEWGEVVIHTVTEAYREQREPLTARFDLPEGCAVLVQKGQGLFIGSLDPDGADPESADVLEGMERLILAHACAGVDVSSPAYCQGITDVLEALP